MVRRVAIAAAVALTLLLGPLERAAIGDWGSDIDSSGGSALLESVRADLVRIVKAPEAERGALVAGFVESRAAPSIELVKRFRNPELKPLFHAMLAHGDWHVVHRALLVLERLEDGSALPKAWALLAHAEPRIREKAAISCIRLWELGGGKAGVLDAAAAVKDLLAKESDSHVRSCLEALALRVSKKWVVMKVSDEVRVTGPDGLVMTPFLDGMDKAPQVAPGAALKQVFRTGGGSASKLAPAKRWTTPLLGFGREEVAGASLQPFGNPRQEGTVFHTGLDVGGYADGSGLYACAEGIVKLVHSGSDMGTLIVLEHRVTERDLVTILYMHSSDVVFVKAGDAVEAGQLLGSMGVGFSFENGGHFAHLHLGVYPGPFQATHNYGYKPASQGLRDWFDPAVVIPDWIDRTRPPLLVEDLGPVPPELAPVASLVREGKYAKAISELDARLAAPSGDAAVRAEAERVRKLLVEAGVSLVERAKARRAKGFPSEARVLLTRDAALLAGLPDGEVPAKTAAAWDADPAFKKDLAAEARFEKALANEATVLAKNGPAKARAVWDDLLKDEGDTCVADRVRAKIAEAAAAR